MGSSRLNAVIGFIILFVIVNNFLFFPSNILSWDVFGYYLYLPFQFIYNDLGIKDDSVIHAIIEKYGSTASFYQATKIPDGSYVMKYSMGLSFFYAPFFFIGHLFAKILNFPQDGFSLPYQCSIFIGGIIYSLLGIWALTKVLLNFFSQRITIILLLVIVFATNYILHITMYGQNALSHNYLFTSYALILWLTILWHKTPKLKYALLLALVCGITILSRPTEIVCLIIPLLWGIKDRSTFFHKLKLLMLYKKHVLILGVIIFLIGLCQLLYWKILTGNFFYYSYGTNAGEGMDLLTPHITEVLFSFRKGWLIYTPVMIFACIGFYFMYKRNRPIFYSLIIYFIINLYFVSSWSCWWYAQSFSQRALIPSYPVMAVALGYFIVWLTLQKNIIRVSGYFLITAFLILNIFQTVQYHYGIIDGDRMTRDYYLTVFGQLKVSEAEKELLLIKRSFDANETFANETDYTSLLSKKIGFESVENKDSLIVHSGQYALKLDSLNIYSPGIELPYNEMTEKDHAWVRASAWVYLTQPLSSNPFSLVVHFTNEKGIYKYRAFDIDRPLELNSWNKISFDYLTPEVRKKTDYLKVYIWHRGKYPVYIDDLEIDIFEKISPDKNI